MFFRSQFFGFPQCFCAVARKSLGLQDVFWAKTSCWSGVCAAPAGGRIPRENAISGMISRISAKGGKREISDVGRWRLLQPLPMRTTATSGQVPQRRQSCVLRQLPRRLARGVHPRRAAHRRAAAQQLVVPRLRHRGGDAGHLKFGFPRSFFVVVTPAPGCFLGVVKNFIKARARIAPNRPKSRTCSRTCIPGCRKC